MFAIHKTPALLICCRNVDDGVASLMTAKLMLELFWNAYLTVDQSWKQLLVSNILMHEIARVIPKIWHGFYEVQLYLGHYLW